MSLKKVFVMLLGHAIIIVATLEKLVRKNKLDKWICWIM